MKNVGFTNGSSRNLYIQWTKAILLKVENCTPYTQLLQGKYSGRFWETFKRWLCELGKRGLKSQMKRKKEKHFKNSYF